MKTNQIELVMSSSSQDDEMVLIIHRNLEKEETVPPRHERHAKYEETVDGITGIVPFDDDPEELIRQPCYNSKLTVEYNILLSPTYQVPILYFFLRNNNNPSVKGPEGLLDVVYKHLVPAQYRSELRDVGIMGGLSLGHHPLSNLPVCFVHPCNTPAAMRDVAADKTVTTETYLLLWLGLVGNCVSLYVPKELLVDKRNP
ncbi:hypothetical protein AJ79_09505 [Helicocarpus griseus UAMH5409]|uniref:Ubiquitin-like-conjugating enzyme ATG10 n=1 Tax=Helicocarpus griseus UAMH5409 TaxID=1447875 RepID=A0A2B7WJ23_9EURO|nr:hypothetical protein AJ79_09505 [Helicocarpus griseus UAMH5409]